MNWFADKKIIVTGGSSGIGKAIASECVRKGAHVAILARTPSRLDSAVQEIRSRAPSAHRAIISAAIDVSDRLQVNREFPRVIEGLGGIDVLVNSAGISWPGYLESIPDAVWDSLIMVDYMGTVNTVRACLPYLKKQKHGNIANISSVLGYMGVFGYAAYGAAKFAVVGFSECIRQDLLPYNIRISVIYPPDTDTPQWHEENRIKPPETRVLAGTIKVVSAEKVARACLKGIASGKFTIIPGGMNRFTYFMNRYLPRVVWTIVSGQLRGYWKKHPPA